VIPAIEAEVVFRPVALIVCTPFCLTTMDPLEPVLLVTLTSTYCQVTESTFRGTAETLVLVPLFVFGAPPYITLKAPVLETLKYTTSEKAELHNERGAH
jgi:hypothetical protein